MLYISLGESSVARAQLPISTKFELSPSHVCLVATNDVVGKQIQRRKGESRARV
jgi:hypothetical protein